MRTRPFGQPLVKCILIGLNSEGIILETGVDLHLTNIWWRVLRQVQNMIIGYLIDALFPNLTDFDWDHIIWRRLLISETGIIVKTYLLHSYLKYLSTARSQFHSSPTRSLNILQDMRQHFPNLKYSSLKLNADNSLYSCSQPSFVIFKL